VKISSKHNKSHGGAGVDFFLLGYPYLSWLKAPGPPKELVYVLIV